MTDITIGLFGSPGKTAIGKMFLIGSYSDTYSSNFNNATKKISINGKSFNISLVDIPEEDSFGVMRYSYFSHAQCYILFYDASDKISFKNISTLYFDIKDSIEHEFYCAIVELNSESRNNGQLNNVVQINEVKKLSAQLQCTIHEISEKTENKFDLIITNLVSDYVFKKEKDETKKVEKEKKDFKICIFGSSDTKNIRTSFFRSIFYNDDKIIFPEDFVKTVDFGNCDVDISIISTPNDIDFNENKSFYLSLIQGYIFICDVSDPKSFADTVKLYFEILNNVDKLFCVIAILNSDKSPYMTNFKKISSELSWKVIEFSKLRYYEDLKDIFYTLIKSYLDNNYQIKNLKKSIIDIKIGMLGSPQKSDLISLFTNKKKRKKITHKIEIKNVNNDEYLTTLDIDSKKVNLKIFDVPKNYHSFLKIVQGFLIFFDMTDQNSINNVKQLYSEILNANIKDIFLIICGLHSELHNSETDNQNLISEIKKLSDDLECDIIEISSETGENIEKAFIDLIRNIMYEVSINRTKYTLVGNSVNAKDIFDIEMVNIGKSGAIQLARKFVLGNLSKSDMEPDLIKIVEVSNVICPLRLITSEYPSESTLQNKSQGTIFVIDIKNTFDKIENACKKWQSENGDDFVGIIAANNCETYDESDYDRINELELKVNMKVIAVSSETNLNVEELFYLITKQIIEHKKQKKIFAKQKRHKKKKVTHTHI